MDRFYKRWASHHSIRLVLARSAGPSLYVQCVWGRTSGWSGDDATKERPFLGARTLTHTDTLYLYRFV